MEALSIGRTYDLCLLMDPDIPFVPDGLRDGSEIRNAMHGRFNEELLRRGKHFMCLAGDHSKLLSAAIEACDRILPPWP